jgi:hypothetical protein
MWIWEQSSGTLWRNGVLISRGYSGKERGKNNPSLQGLAGIGPIPRGQWKIVRRYDSPNVGPYTLELRANDKTPNNDVHDETGRSAFRIHGDSIKRPGTASKGCIILPRQIREKIWSSGDRDLKVIA